MAHESFENGDTAAIMNREFVSIKVDREERPDVDRVYMTFVQATTGGGGWPMSVWLTPALEPFVGGTYFPPQDRHGQPAFAKVLQKIADAWKNDRAKIVAQSAQILSALREATVTGKELSNEIQTEWFDAAYQQFARSFDAHEGGFGRAPKFPRPSVFNFLTRFHGSTKSKAQADHALAMTVTTLRKMAAGGMHDQIGGGFHRYSVDERWHVPHFPKMLYDQAQLATAYLDAFQITGLPEFEKTARDILDYVQRDLTSPEGGFYSAEDADSTVAGSEEKREGAFYVWKKAGIDTVLGEEVEAFCFRFGVEEKGNVEPGSDPQGEFAGQNILFEKNPVAETARQFKRKETEIEESLARSRQRLQAARAERPRPHLDDKIIAAWNGLMISAFARAAQIWPDYLPSALRAAEFVRAQLWDDAQKILYRSYRGSRSKVAGFADDYAFLIEGLLDLYQACFEIRWLEWALELQVAMDQLFLDEKTSGYFIASAQDKTILLRSKEDNDSAEPAASSIAALNLARLGAMRADAELTAQARRTVAAFSAPLTHFPSALPQMLVAADFLNGDAQQIVIAGARDDDGVQELLAEVRRKFRPRVVVLLADDARARKFFGKNNAAFSEMKPVKDQAAAYVCENFTCRAPVTSGGQLRELLDA